MANPDGYPLQGVELTPSGGCRHYHSPLDVIAIRLPCCGVFYACIDCHLELADHPPLRWPRDRFREAAVLCCACHSALSISDYLSSPDRCPRCGAGFNPGCRCHHDRYFEP